MYSVYWTDYRRSTSCSVFYKLKFTIMKINMGGADRTIRALIAVAIAVLYFTNVITGKLAIVLLIVGAVFLLTSVVGFCPLYAPFGIRTCPKK